jgi:raffinose/stachyose/melibiose transport system permease protein
MKSKNFNISKLFIIILFLLLVLIPLYLPIINSFKTTSGLYKSPFSLPKDIMWSNYSEAWVKGNLFQYLINSTIVTVASVLLVVILSSMVAFALTRKRTFKNLNRVVFIFFLMGIMVPPQVGIVPLYLLMKHFHLSNTLFGLVIVYVAYQMSFAVFILYSFFKNIPEDIEDAAIIDGCSNFTLFSRIILPLSRSAMIAVVIFAGTYTWNNFLFPLVLITSNSKKTLAIGLMGFRGRWLSDYPILFAGVTIVSIPLVITYLILQDKFVEGLTKGSLKG